MPRPQIDFRSLFAAPARGARIAEFFFRRRDAGGDVFPNDPTEGAVPGPDPDRILFLGEPGELSLGVRTHDLSLPAFFARHHAKATGRGVVWSIVFLPKSRLHDAPEMITGLRQQLAGIDTVVVLTGISDTLRVTPPHTWEKQFRATIDALQLALPCGGRILVGEIPPMDNAGSLSKPARIAAGVHGRMLNTRTRLLARDYPAVTVVKFPAELTRSVWRPESEEHRYQNTYKVWGEHLAARTIATQNR